MGWWKEVAGEWIDGHGWVGFLGRAGGFPIGPCSTAGPGSCRGAACADARVGVECCTVGWLLGLIKPRPAVNVAVWGPPARSYSLRESTASRSRYTSVEFLNAVSPRAVLVSVGAGNRYRHPDPGLIGGLERAGAAVRRTDTAGDIALVGGLPRRICSSSLAVPHSRRRGEAGQHMALMVGEAAGMAAPSRPPQQRK
jgi:hypothetical protein